MKGCVFNHIYRKCLNVKKEGKDLSDDAWRNKESWEGIGREQERTRTNSCIKNKHSIEFSKKMPLLNLKYGVCVCLYKVVEICPGQTVTCLHTNSPVHI
jgi:hypothetical protein